MKCLIPFELGDAVQLNAKALELCDPSLTLTEARGEVVFINVFAETVQVLFDDGQRITYPASYLEKFEP